jgi:23S rRNA pseudouridine1911/1915/1917 synthase
MDNNMPCKSNQTNNFNFTVSEAAVKMRLDAFIAQQIPGFSRTYCQKLVETDRITINGLAITRSSTQLKKDDLIAIQVPPPPALGVPKPFEGDLGVKMVHEDPNFLIVSKPAGLVVHVPVADSKEVTLVDWLLAKFHTIADVGSPERPGIVHRLDKDTSGIMVIPRNAQAHSTFGEMFKDRQIHKTYLAIVKGIPPSHGTIELPIDRHPNIRSRMTHIDTNRAQRWGKLGRDAVTHYRVIEQFYNAALVEVKPVTGRTHQIRVHFAAIRHPLLGDSIYGVESPHIQRQALHAQALNFTFDGVEHSFTQEPPEDFKKLLATLRS